MLTTQGSLDGSRDLPSMFDTSLDLDSRCSMSSSDTSDREHGSHRSDNFNGFDHGNVIMADITEHDELSSTQNRLETFKSWPKSSPLQPRDLAAAGFYYLGADDQVQCFKCDLILRQWRPGEDPWHEHKQFRPSCPFIREVESGGRFKVTCEPVEVSSSAQNEGQFPFAEGLTRYRDKRHPFAAASKAYPPEVACQTEPASHDPRFPLYQERFHGHDVEEERRPGLCQERLFPMSAQTGSYGNRQAAYQGNVQEIHGKNPRTTTYHRPEQSMSGGGVPRNQYVVVRQGDRVHIQGAAVYQLHPEDKVHVHVGGQGYPCQLSNFRELRSSYPETNEAIQGRSESEGNHQPHQPISLQSSQSVALQESSKTRFSTGYGVVNVSEETSRVFDHKPGIFSTGGRTLVYSTQQSPGFITQPPVKSGMQQNKSYVQETGKSKTGYDKQLSGSSGQIQPVQEGEPYPSQPGQGFYGPHITQKRAEDEEKSTWAPHYPDPRTEVVQENYPPPSTRENSFGRTVQGSRSAFPGNVAFPVQDPSLSTTQRPLFRQEEARHVASPSELSSEHHRLTTFVDWPHDCPIREWELSEAGFYYLGTGDSVKCYKCGIALRNWDPTDTPWGEHKKWSPNCPLVIEHFSRRARRDGNIQWHRVTSGERFTFSPEEYQAQRRQNSQGPYDGQVPARRSSPPSAPREATEQSPYQVTYTPESQHGPIFERHYPPSSQQGLMTASLQESQMVSGSSLVSPGGVGERRECARSPSISSTSPAMASPRGLSPLNFDLDRLAEMGFNQQEIDEIVGKRIEDTGSSFGSLGELVFALVDRRPGQESLLHGPLDENETQSRPLVTAPTTLAGTMPRENEDSRTRRSASSGSVSTPTTPVPQMDSLRRSLSAPVASLTESEESLEQKLERMQEERTCKICMDDEVGVVFQPCGHLSCCPMCASGMDQCPMCRRPIQEKIRIYLS